MHVFRVEEVPAGERLVNALRVVTDGARLHFQSRVAGSWYTSVSIPTERVERVYRLDIGESGWIPVRPQPMVE